MCKAEFIRNKESDKKCYICNGTGHVENQFQCGACNGTGIFVDNSYILVVTDNSGNKIAFDVDQGGK
jgi:DnaJ-class molecular chaperone